MMLLAHVGSFERKKGVFFVLLVFESGGGLLVHT